MTNFNDSSNDHDNDKNDNDFVGDEKEKDTGGVDYDNDDIENMIGIYIIR